MINEETQRRIKALENDGHDRPKKSKGHHKKHEDHGTDTDANIEHSTEEHHENETATNGHHDNENGQDINGNGHELNANGNDHNDDN
jgi:hypothetical protein